QVQMQLRDILQMTFQEPPQKPTLPYSSQEPSTRPPPEPFPDMRRLPRTLFGRSDFVIITSQYQMIFPTETMEEWKNLSEVKAFVEQIKNEQMNMEYKDVMSLKVGVREYYFVSIPTRAVEETTLHYLIYYIDMTSVAQFVQQMNVVLGLLFIVALLFALLSAYFLSHYITKPISHLTNFAEEIGKGKFQPVENQYKDKELFDLANSMNKTAKRLELLNQEEKFFFQNVSHELRTPLQIIQSNAEGVQKNIIPQSKAILSILAETETLRRMVNDLLYYSTLESTYNESKNKRYDIREILHNCTENFSPLLKQQHIQLVYHFDSEPVVFNCDEKRMSKAFTNLISNAIQYAQSRIHIVCSQDNQGIQIRIENDGGPIPQKDVFHVFERFYKGTKGNYGIGLSIVKAIVEEYNGTISIASTQQTTCFTIMFSTDSNR
ncbi:MAG: HAMP domain-containing sensor histidine kinase, partial [Caldisericia bacterium]|nr:HAMP domain-containing sensor histidine kinase [Caldisericia bacterium]